MSHKTILRSRSLLFVFFVYLSFILVGCTPSLVGENAAVFSMRRLHARINSDMATVNEASVVALEKLEIKVVDKKKDVFGAKIVGKTSDEKTITIKIKPAENNSSKLIICVGTFGNEMRSRAIYEQIRKELGQVTGG
ncbi:MAG: DUF3568 family protein [Sedimentisphaerales bacterium]|nr:DUF3568 family protein [Sedimentisphaerales bacterium]